MAKGKKSEKVEEAKESKGKGKKPFMFSKPKGKGKK